MGLASDHFIVVRTCNCVPSWPHFMVSTISQFAKEKKCYYLKCGSFSLCHFTSLESSKIVADNVGSGGRLEILEMCLGWILSILHWH
jgi:hypothetical protein